MYEKVKAIRQLVLNKVQTGVEEERTSRMVGLLVPGGKLYRRRRRQVRDLEGRMKFMVRAAYDVLPSPSNLHLWALISSLCPVLKEGR